MPDKGKDTIDPARRQPDPVHTEFGEDAARPADNMRPGYDAHDPSADPGVVVDPVVDPNTKDDVPEADDGEDADIDESKPASMSMTKDELLGRLRRAEEKLTKAEILDRLERFDDEDARPKADAALMTGPFDTAKREATVNGEHYSWTASTEHTVPEEARLVWARARQAGSA
jgi:hypothetical protein